MKNYSLSEKINLCLFDIIHIAYSILLLKVKTVIIFIEAHYLNDNNGVWLNLNSLLILKSLSNMYI